MYTEWLQEEGLEPKVWCPYKRDTGHVVVGMTYMGEKPPGDVVGSFRWVGPKRTQVEVSLYVDDTEFKFGRH